MNIPFINSNKQRFTGLFFLRSVLIVSLFTAYAHATLKLPLVISSGMVMQRNAPVPVWGWADAGDSVSISLNDMTFTAEADTGGRWKIVLPAMDAGGPYVLSVQNGVESKTLSDVYVGDVWLASGQSNMEFALSSADGGAAAIAATNDPLFRQFKVSKGLADEPSDELTSSSAWRPATSQYAGNFSAVGFFFGQELRETLGIPVGILNVSYGGSRIETWMSDAMLGYDERDIILANGEPERQPTTAYNKMLHPLLQFPIKGVIWYQGESNADTMEDALAYDDLFKTMITGWRELYGLGDIPFLWVQLPNYGTVYDQPQTWDTWPRLRQAQTSALALPNTGQAVTIDVGDRDIHPTNKQPVGYRLSLIARKVAYGEDELIASGPCYQSNVLREDGRIAIRFTDIGSGLKAKDSDNGTVGGFALSGEDDQLKWADAVIEDDQIIVWNEAVTNPVIVRYAWEYNPATANLLNQENLPAAPFETYVNQGFKIMSFKTERSAVEQGQSTALSWVVYGASAVTLDNVPVDSASTLTVTPTETTTYTLVAINREDATERDTATVTIEVLDPNMINRVLNQSVISSTFEACCGEERIPEYAIDGDFETRWSSAWQQGDASTAPDPNIDENPDDEWIAIDMGDAIDLDRVILYWEAAYGSSYDLELSYDGYFWKTVYEERAGNGGEDNIVFDTPPSGRYLRIHGINRATQYGYSLYEIAAYGIISSLRPPTAKVNSATGNVFLPGSEATFTATTTDEDGIVKEVAFYIDGELVMDDAEEPFEATWVAIGSGEHQVTAVATDDQGLSVQSEPYMVFVDDGVLVRFEAESATATGQAAKTKSTATSGGYYMMMNDAWTLTFNNIHVPESGNYFLSIGYQLTYESPKTQYLVINEDTLTTIEFTAPSASDWLQYGLEVPLVAGDNEIAIHGFWNWMSFDFIAVEGASVSSVEEGIVQPQEMMLNQNYPNPFNNATTISFSVAEPCQVTLKLYDTLGRDVRTLLNEPKKIGDYQITLNMSDLTSGVYFYKFQAGSFLESRKLLLLK